MPTLSTDVISVTAWRDHIRDFATRKYPLYRSGIVDFKAGQAEFAKKGNGTVVNIPLILDPAWKHYVMDDSDNEPSGDGLSMDMMATKKMGFGSIAGQKDVAEEMSGVNTIAEAVEVLPEVVLEHNESLLVPYLLNNMGGLSGDASDLLTSDFSVPDGDPQDPVADANRLTVQNISRATTLKFGKNAFARDAIVIVHPDVYQFMIDKKALRADFKEFGGENHEIDRFDSYTMVPIWDDRFKTVSAGHTRYTSVLTNPGTMYWHEGGYKTRPVIEIKDNSKTGNLGGGKEVIVRRSFTFGLKGWSWTQAEDNKFASVAAYTNSANWELKLKAEKMRTIKIVHNI